ncbi:solute carrier family 13 member 1-like isoform X2 [Ornithodoros turicata]|uniref:solute carrier family 13 member 1-like isoform X2 n=1 Tax=Ornithodoros turicata TaxID=34597 RepID=UPI00313A3B5A
MGEAEKTSKVSTMKVMENWIKLAPVILAIILCVGVSNVIDTEALRIASFLFIVLLFLALELFPASVVALFPLILLPALDISPTDKVAEMYIGELQVSFLCCMFTLLAIVECGVYNRLALFLLSTVQGRVSWLLFILTSMAVCLGLLGGETIVTLPMLPLAEAIADEMYLDLIEAELTMSQRLDSQVCSPYLPVTTSPLTGSGSSEKPRRRPSYTHHVMSLMPRRRVSFRNRVVVYNDIREKDYLISERNTVRQLLYLVFVYGSNIGVACTLLGNSLSSRLHDFVNRSYGNSHPLTTASWYCYSVPNAVISATFLWAYIYKFHFPSRLITADSPTRMIYGIRHRELGSVGFRECATCGMLFTMVTVHYYFQSSSGDTYRFINARVIYVATVSLLFLIPAYPMAGRHGPPLIRWTSASKKMPWGCLFLIGCGSIISFHFTTTSFDIAAMDFVVELNAGPKIVCSLLLCVLVATFCEIRDYKANESNLFQAVNRMAMSEHTNPLMFLVPVARVSNFVTMLPLLSYPTTVLYEYFGMTVPAMIKTGVCIKMALVLIELSAMLCSGYVFFGLHEFPAWAVNFNATLK